MKTLLFILLSWIVVNGLSAQNNHFADISVLSASKMQEERMKEKCLDSIWRAEDMSGKPFKDLSVIESPRWAVWGYDLEKYFTSRMVYPKHMLTKNQAGYSIVMFSLDTLGLPHNVSILTTRHKDFDKEVIRLVKELPHCLPCRDKNGKRMECLYTVYVPKQSFVEWEAVSYFQDGKPGTAQDYITQRLVYDPSLLGDKQQIRGLYTIRINSYGEVYEADVLRSCGIQVWDNQVLEIIKDMPRWTPTINYYGKGEYRNSVWTTPIFFKKGEKTD